MIGDADEYEAEKARLAYQNNPVVKTVNALLNESQDGTWNGTANDLMEAGKRITGAPLAATAQSLGYELRKLATKFPPNGVRYNTVSNGNAGKRHYFSLYT